MENNCLVKQALDKKNDLSFLMKVRVFGRAEAKKTFRHVIFLKAKNHP